MSIPEKQEDLSSSPDMAHGNVMSLPTFDKKEDENMDQNRVFHYTDKSTEWKEVFEKKLHIESEIDEGEKEKIILSHQEQTANNEKFVFGATVSWIANEKDHLGPNWQKSNAFALATKPRERLMVRSLSSKPEMMRRSSAPTTVDRYLRDHNDYYNRAEDIGNKQGGFIGKYESLDNHLPNDVGTLWLSCVPKQTDCGDDLYHPEFHVSPIHEELSQNKVADVKSKQTDTFVDNKSGRLEYWQGEKLEEICVNDTGQNKAGDYNALVTSNTFATGIVTGFITQDISTDNNENAFRLPTHLTNHQVNKEDDKGKRDIFPNRDFSSDYGTNLDYEEEKLLTEKVVPTTNSDFEFHAQQDDVSEGADTGQPDAKSSSDVILEYFEPDFENELPDVDTWYSDSEPLSNVNDEHPNIASNNYYKENPPEQSDPELSNEEDSEYADIECDKSCNEILPGSGGLGQDDELQTINENSTNSDIDPETTEPSEINDVLEDSSCKLEDEFDVDDDYSNTVTENRATITEYNDKEDSVPPPFNINAARGPDRNQQHPQRSRAQYDERYNTFLRIASEQLRPTFHPERFARFGFRYSQTDLGRFVECDECHRRYSLTEIESRSLRHTFWHEDGCSYAGGRAPCNFCIYQTVANDYEGICFCLRCGQQIQKAHAFSDLNGHAEVVLPQPDPVQGLQPAIQANGRQRNLEGRAYESCLTCHYNIQHRQTEDVCRICGGIICEICILQQRPHFH